MLKQSVVVHIFNPSTQDEERLIDVCEPVRVTQGTPI